MKPYDHSKIEQKWQTQWQKKKAYKAENNSEKKKQYVLDMFPYPSGAGLHVGHPKGYIGSDVYARMKRMQGFNVLYPMGYDAFGLPAEQYALQHNISPKKAVAENVKTFEKQLSIIGLSYDWERRVNTTDPNFYHWTQWIFLKIYDSWYDRKADKARPIAELVKIFQKYGSMGADGGKVKGNIVADAVGDATLPFTSLEWKAKSEKEKQEILMKYRLAYEGKALVNWCPELGTVLANDEIVDGPDGKPVSERGGFPVEKKEMRQWFMRITAYADRLLTGLDGLNWSEHVKEIERNWIGRSEGAEIAFGVKMHDITVFTTRPDTIFGVTFLAVSPEMAQIWLDIGWQASVEIKEYVEKTLQERKTEDFQEKEKTGIYAGFDAVNPANNEKVPIWIVNYVLGTVGTGAIMGVPAHDERDFEFAKKYNLAIKKVIEGGDENSVFVGNGSLVNSGKFDGMDSESAKSEIVKFVRGKMVTKYKMRDAVFARQRYWGEPIPLITDKSGLIHEVPASQLPLKLPNVKSYKPTGTGESPLAGVSRWVRKGYETNTMPGWAGSSWYFLRYMDPQNKKKFADKKAVRYWQNVDMYVGGTEHATGHILYARFWHKFLKDYGLVPTEEPFQTWKSQGYILGTDGRKMSKRWGNVVNPDEVVKNFGADTLRVYEMFMGPFEGTLPWSTDNLIGSRRFVERVWKLQSKVVLEKVSRVTLDNDNYRTFETTLHKTIQKVGSDIENFAFNTAVSAMMIVVNEMEKLPEIHQSDFELFLKILSPFAPHVAEEIWHELGNKTLIVQENWPVADAKKMKESQVKVVIQVNSKVRAEMIVALDASEQDITEAAKKLPAVDKWLAGKEIKKIIYIPGRLLNIVAQ